MTTTRSTPSPEAGPGGPTNAVLFDTNVWLDYALGWPETVDDIVELIERIKAAGDSLVTTASIKKDVFYIVPRELRRRARAEGVESGRDPKTSAALNQIAWAVLEQIDNLATVVPLSMREDFFARHLQDRHADYEDDLLMATAHAIGARWVVTSDMELVRTFGGQCLTPRQALERY